MQPEATRPERFYDVETGGPLQLQLQPEGARYRLLRAFGYRDPAYQDAFVVPADLDGWRTDLASIPWFFAWLVPGLGTHLPAVLLHDGLVVGRGEDPTHIGPAVDREEADRILRDAMASLGTPVIRRWLMWTATIMATAVSTLRPRAYWIAVVAGTLLAIAALGTVATLDALDVWDVLPWMGARPWFVELASGAVFAVLIPLVLSLLWRRLWAAGAIAGISLALLLHVTAAVCLVGGVYWLAEELVSSREDSSASPKANLEDAVS